MKQYNVPAIAHVAVRKCHQRQDEILIFFTWNQQSCFSIGRVRISNKRLLCETRIYSKHESVCCANWIALSVLHDRAFLKTSLG